MIGSTEEMMRAACIMRDSADRNEQAARNIEGSFERFARQAEDWIQRLEQIGAKIDTILKERP